MKRNKSNHNMCPFPSNLHLSIEYESFEYGTLLFACSLPIRTNNRLRHISRGDSATSDIIKLLHFVIRVFILSSTSSKSNMVLMTSKLVSVACRRKIALNRAHNVWRLLHTRFGWSVIWNMRSAIEWVLPCLCVCMVANRKKKHSIRFDCLTYQIRAFQCTDKTTNLCYFLVGSIAHMTIWSFHFRGTQHSVAAEKIHAKIRHLFWLDLQSPIWKSSHRCKQPFLWAVLSPIHSFYAMTFSLD